MPLKTYQDELPSINLTPMIDIVFNLIIFFVVGTRFVGAESKLPVQVPEVSEAGKLAPVLEKHVLNVYRDGQISLNDKFLTTGQLRQELEAARTRCPGLSVIVRGDGEGSVVETHATPIDETRCAVVEATLATSDRPQFGHVLRFARWARPWRGVA